MIFKKLHGREYYKKIWIFLVLFVVVLQIPFSLLLYHLSNQKIMSSITSSNTSILKQIQANMTYFSSVTSNLCMEVFMDNKTKTVMYTDIMDYYDAITYMQQIHDTSLMVYPSIDSITIYNANNDQYFSTESASIFNPDDLANFVESQDSIPCLQPILRKVTHTINGSEKSYYVFSYFMYEFNDPTKGTEGYVVVNENVNWFIENISAQTEKDKIQGNIYLSSQSGEIYETEANTVSEAHQYLVKDYWNHLEAENEDGIFTYQTKYDGKTYIVSGIHLNNQSNAIVLIQEYDYIFEDLIQLKNDMLYISMGFGFLALLMLVLVSKQLYSPVQEFVTSISGLGESKSESEKYQNEFDYLREAYRTTWRQNQLLQKAKQEHEPMVMKYELSQMVMDSTPERLEKFKKHNPTHWLMTEIPVGIILFKIEDITGNTHFDKSDIQLMTYAVENIIHEKISEKRAYSCFFMSTDTLCVLTGYTEGEALEDSLIPLIKECQNLILEHLDLTLTVSLSSYSVNRHSLTDLLKEAREYLQYRYLFGLGEILYHETCRFNLNNQQSHYSYELDVKLKSAIQTKNLNSTLVAIEEISNIISTFQYRSATTCMMALITQINMIFNEMIREQRILSNINFNAIYQKAAQSETLKEAIEQLKQYITSILDTEKEAEENAKDSLISAVIAFVQAHYSDVNLSSQMIGDSLALSPRYIMHKFKESTGLSLNEYIVNLRMSKAATLLQNTDYTVNQIIKEIGIENSTYFYKLFKKAYHCTPREFSKRDEEET